MSQKIKIPEQTYSQHKSKESLYITNSEYEQSLAKLQVELIRVQNWVRREGKRLAIVFEGREAAGKGGAIKRFAEHMNPRGLRIVALPKPTALEREQWYFQRYIQQLPNAGEIVFFDRSWYNRAIVEKMNDYCTEVQYERFLKQVPLVEDMLAESGIILIKLWFSISKQEQKNRFDKRSKNPLKKWKTSPIDIQSQKNWALCTQLKNTMFKHSHSLANPWTIIQANNKKIARLESIKYVLSHIPYQDKKEKKTIVYNSKIVQKFDLFHWD